MRCTSARSSAAAARRCAAAELCGTDAVFDADKDPSAAPADPPPPPTPWSENECASKSAVGPMRAVSSASLCPGDTGRVFSPPPGATSEAAGRLPPRAPRSAELRPFERRGATAVAVHGDAMPSEPNEDTADDPAESGCSEVKISCVLFVEISRLRSIKVARRPPLTSMGGDNAPAGRDRACARAAPIPPLRRRAAVGNTTAADPPPASSSGIAVRCDVSAGGGTAKGEAVPPSTTPAQ